VPVRIGVGITGMGWYMEDNIGEIRVALFGGSKDHWAREPAGVGFYLSPGGIKLPLYQETGSGDFSW
jgi:hypothetical protein